RVLRAAQPRLTVLQRALARDIERVRTASVSDMPSLLVKLDELVRLADDLAVANAMPTPPGAGSARAASQPVLPWWRVWLNAVADELRGLVRVSRIELPEAALLSPEQSFFLRENYKLKLLNARLGLLARQVEPARADLTAARNALGRYFDPASRRTQASDGLLQQVLEQTRQLQLPRIDDTLAALATAAAGR
ncbi:MAG: hypothetical protein FGM55_16675, partial [Rhodoferax sp.]|nr:hypothetical protein [Rhodoferax sp.]